MKILLGVTGSVASFKSLEIGRLFKKNGIDVIPVLTKNATKFVTSLSFETLLQTKAWTDLFPSDTSQITPLHLQLLENVNCILVAPCSANIIGKMTQGIADDLLSTILLSANVKVFLAPAMHTNLWNNIAVQENVKKLRTRGVIFIGPETGELSDFKKGIGRLSEPSKIFETVNKFLRMNKIFENKKLLLTFGRTEEDVDPVRVITNRSSGKMGWALLEEATLLGMNVRSIVGKTDFEIPENENFIKVRTAEEMYREVKKYLIEWAPDILIMNAAVSDFKPTHKKKSKIKKTDSFSLKFVKTRDILSSVAKEKKKNQIFIGFALESENIKKNILQKMKSKALDILVVNPPSVLEKDMTKIVIFTGEKEHRIPKMSKREASFILYKILAERYEFLP